jgi:hypothetical protein
MKWWFKPVLAVLVAAEIAAGVVLGSDIYQKQARTLGAAVSVKSKLLNVHNPQSNLKYYYEPVASTSETDRTSWLQEPVRWTYNADTLNSEKDYSVTTPPKTFRIITLGDSHTFGDHVNTTDAWPHKLEELLNSDTICPKYEKYEVLNLGICGFDIQDEVERYKIRGQKYNPDLVIWMMGDNDFDEINELSKQFQVPYYENFKKENTLTESEMLSRSITLGQKDFLQKYDEKLRFSIISSFVYSFNQMYKGPLMLVTYPFTLSQYKHLMQQWTQQRTQTWYFDTLPNVYADWSISFQKYNDGHPNVRGHSLIANDIYRFLIDNRIFCKEPKF